MKRFSTITFTSLLVLIIQLLGLPNQVLGQRNFEVIGMPGRQGPKLAKYFKKKDIPIARLMTLSAITNPYDPDSRDKIYPTNIRKYLRSRYPEVNDTGMLVLNWELNPFKNLRIYPKTDERYQEAAAQWRALIRIIREERPLVKIGIYGIPFKVWGKWQLENYNPDGKYDHLLSLCDFLAPSLYINFPNEEVGRERNIKFLEDNLNITLTIGKRLHKPVYPFVWHRVHFTNPLYGHRLIQKGILADYVKFISTYSHENYKAKGVVLWEEGELENRKDYKSMGDHLKGFVTDPASYDQQMVNYAASILKGLSENDNDQQKPEEEINEVSSFTLINADTNEPIITLEDGDELNLATLPTRNVSIEAEADLDQKESVVLRLSGDKVHSQVESIAPYALFGGEKDDYTAWRPSVGNYTLKAIPYSAPAGSGQAGQALTINFSVVDRALADDEKLISFRLINADTNQGIRTLTSGTTLNLATLPTRKLNIGAQIFSDEKVHRVEFKLSGAQKREETEKELPYTLFSDNSGEYYAWTPETGNYTLRATVYLEEDGEITIGDTKIINFRVIDQPDSDQNNQAGVLVYPNPATTKITIKANGVAGGETVIKLYDLAGDDVRTWEVQSVNGELNAELNVSSLEKGRYILKVTSPAGLLTRQHIVIN